MIFKRPFPFILVGFDKVGTKEFTGLIEHSWVLDDVLRVHQLLSESGDVLILPLDDNIFQIKFFLSIVSELVIVILKHLDDLHILLFPFGVFSFEKHQSVSFHLLKEADLSLEFLPDLDSSLELIQMILIQ